MLVAVCLRAPVLDWGLPPAIPHVIASDIRASYSFDEDDIITGASFTNPALWNFDARIYHWGTFQLILTALVLDAAEGIGHFSAPWRDSYYNMIAGEFERVYRLARWIGVVWNVICVGAVYWLAEHFAGRRAGLWASALVAVSPALFLTSVQVRTDNGAAALLAVAAVLALRAIEKNTQGALLAFGLVCGLAIAMRYPALIVVAAMAGVVLWHTGRRWRQVLLVVGEMTAGVFIGEPYLIARWPDIVRQVSAAGGFGRPVPPPFAVSIPDLFLRHAVNIVRFGLGPIASAFAAAGIVLLFRSKRPSTALLLTALAASLFTFIPLRWPLLRYEALVLPWLAVCAGIALARLTPRLQYACGAAAILFPVAGSIAQFDYMRAPHPANAMLHRILSDVPAGQPISRLIAELPPLDRRTYPMAANPLLDDLSQACPAWVLTTDLPGTPYLKSTQQLLANDYDEIASFRSRRILGWATLGESGAPHDWKYTHPTMSLYRRRTR
jgi:hypothetical protein